MLTYLAFQLMSIIPLVPFPEEVEQNSKVYASYQLVNISPIIISGIEDESILPPSMHLIKDARSCGRKTRLFPGQSCMLQLFFEAPAYKQVWQGKLKEY